MSLISHCRTARQRLLPLQVYLLAAINAAFTILLYVLFTLTGSLNDLQGFEVTPSRPRALAHPRSSGLAMLRHQWSTRQLTRRWWQFFRRCFGCHGANCRESPKSQVPRRALWITRAQAMAFAGMFAFSLIVGFVKKAIKGRIKDLKMGKGRVLEEQFSMIIGWNDRVLPLVEQLCLANESAGGKPIVVMAPKKKPWMDAFFQATLHCISPRDTHTPNQPGFAMAG